MTSSDETPPIAASRGTARVARKRRLSASTNSDGATTAPEERAPPRRTSSANPFAGECSEGIDETGDAGLRVADRDQADDSNEVAHFRAGAEAVAKRTLGVITGDAQPVDIDDELGQVD